MKNFHLPFLFLAATHQVVSQQINDVPSFPASSGGTVSGELKKWHKVTVGFQGPVMDEMGSPNPFTDYRLDVVFQHTSSGQVYTVPGYFAADGNAANSGATSGQVWLVHFAPDLAGDWTYDAIFEGGTKVAQNGGGTPTSFNAATGLFNIGPTDKVGRDHRGKGRLEYVGEHHLQFAETGEWFLKAGADSPENLLAYKDFDNTPNKGGRLKSWAAHQQDYNAGDPTWGGGKGSEIIGAINYLSTKGANAFSFLPMNIQGDDKNVFPYVSDKSGGDRQRIDVSKTAQWEALFEHADHMGMFLHFKTQETENDQLLDNGNLGDERKLYYRELIARFGHHLALNWNMGEENTNTESQQKEFGEFFNQVDPYNHPVVIHTYPGDDDEVYGGLVGDPGYEGASIQTGKSSVFSKTKKWRDQSAAAGRKWVVANDEQGNAQTGVVPDADDPGHDVVRKDVLWGNIMAGGAGVEYYFGYSYANSDLTCQDFTSRANMWDQSRWALEFFQDNVVPFWDMANDNSIVSTGWCLAGNSGEAYVVYLPDGGTASIDLVGPAGTTYDVKWFNPRSGGALQDGSITTLGLGTKEPLGSAPGGGGGGGNDDWVVLLTKITTSPTAPTSATPPPVTPTPSPVATPAPLAPSPPPNSPPVSCGVQDHQGECTTTAQCRGMYTGAYDCKNSDGGVCFCGNNEVCGCNSSPTTPVTSPPIPPAPAPTPPMPTPPGPCGVQDRQGECTSTGQCRGMYTGAYDCKNSEGGVCFCGNNQVCGCL